ncbi:MAG: CHASE domain-containing protein [Alphaproteobacteria bacterium]|nr:CHASE domain-containing protein [Alphaproteobacteria bacterium]
MRSSSLRGGMAKLSTFLARMARGVSVGQHVFAWLFLAAGLAASSVLYLQIQGQADADARSRVESAADAEATVLQRGVEGYLGGLAPMSELMQFPAMTDRAQFRATASDVLARYRGIHAIFWLPRVVGLERSAYEAAARRDGHASFRLWEVDEDGRSIPAVERAEHFPVYMAAPDKQETEILGFDLASQPARRSALDVARDLGVPLIAGRLRLPPSEGGQLALRAIVPVYAAHADLGVIDIRRSALLGYVMAILRVQDMLAAIIPVDRATGFDVYVIDPVAPPAERIVARGGGLPGMADAAAVISQSRAMRRTIEFGGERWIAIFLPRVDPAAMPLSWQGILAGAGGAALTLALTLYLYGYFLRGREIEALIDARTAELGATNEVLRREIGERRDAEAQLREAKLAAETANKAKSEFLATMSHELRTPLNAIIGFSDIIMRQEPDPQNVAQFRQYLTDIHDSATHLLGLINDLLDLSKIDARRFSLAEEEVAIPEVLRSSARMVSTRAQAGQVTVEVAPSTDLPLVIADERALRQMLLNLVSNAVKFTPPGGTVTVSGSLRADGGVDISVKDTGIGIEPRDLARVLEPFGQVDSSLGRRYQGTGLGLPLARRFIELHGGTMSIESAPGKGTTISATLPASRVVRLPFARMST